MHFPGGWSSSFAQFRNHNRQKRCLCNLTVAWRWRCRPSFCAFCFKLLQHQVKFESAPCTLGRPFVSLLPFCFKTHQIKLPSRSFAKFRNHNRQKRCLFNLTVAWWWRCCLVVAVSPCPSRWHCGAAGALSPYKSLVSQKFKFENARVQGALSRDKATPPPPGNTATTRQPSN